MQSIIANENNLANQSQQTSNKKDIKHAAISTRLYRI